MSFPPGNQAPPFGAKGGAPAPADKKHGKKKPVSKKRQAMLDRFAKRVPYGRR